MKITRYDGKDERSVLTAMIVDSTVLGRVAPHWSRGLFQSQWSNLIGGWAVQFFQKYNRPPGKDIEGLFARWAEKAKDKDTIALVDAFLSSLSEEYESLAKDINPAYAIDSAGLLFNRVRMTNDADKVKEFLDSGDLEGAEGVFSSSKKIELGVGAGVNVLEDMAAIQQAFKEKSEPLIEYPGMAGRFFQDSLERDGFIALLGPEKRGKSRWLVDMAWRGMRQRRKIAFFEVGDMSQGQIMRRFMSRAARRPLKLGRSGAWPLALQWPTAIERLEGQKWAEVTAEERLFDKPLSWQSSWKACQAIIHNKTKTKQPLLKLSCFPNSTISVLGIEGMLQNWSRDGWFADCVIIDYADILAPVNPRQNDNRQRINETWAAMRALSQKNHCLVVTATQASAASYGAEWLGMQHFGEMKTKLAHVTGLVGLNQIEEERIRGITRLSWVVVRDISNEDGFHVYCAGLPAINDPCIVSC